MMCTRDGMEFEVTLIWEMYQSIWEKPVKHWTNNNHKSNLTLIMYIIKLTMWNMEIHCCDQHLFLGVHQEYLIFFVVVVI